MHHQFTMVAFLRKEEGVGTSHVHIQLLRLCLRILRLDRTVLCFLPRVMVLSL